MEEIKRCSNCGKPIIDKFAFCPFCGKELEPKCKNCGEPLVEGAKFCSKCGARVESHEEHIQEEHTQSVQTQVSNTVCAPAVEKEKTKLRKVKHTTKGILTLVKRSMVAFVCVLLFALSFAGVLNLSLEKYITSIMGSGIDEDFIEGDVSLYSVDCIELMFTTARHYDKDKDVAKIEKLEDKLTDLAEDLSNSVIDDVRGTKVVLSKESENLLREYVVKTLAYQLSIDGNAGGAVQAEIITAGILFLLNILFTFVMAIISIVAFVKYLGDFLQNKEDDKHAKLDFFVPLLMILPLCAMLPFSTAISTLDIAGAMIASLFFASLAIVVCLTQRFVADAQTAKSAKILVPRIATLALAFIVVGCCFAPCFKAVYDVQLSGKSSSAKYETTLDASAMAGCITNEDEQEAEEFAGHQYKKYSEAAKAIIDQLGNFTAKEFMASDELIAKAYARALIVDGVIAQIDYEGANMLSLGFFLLILVMVISGFYLGGTIVGGKTAKAANCGLSVIIAILLLCAFVLSAVTMEIVNTTMDDIKTNAFELKLGGGLIAAIIVSVGMIVFDALPSKAWEKREDEISDFANENN